MKFNFNLPSPKEYQLHVKPNFFIRQGASPNLLDKWSAVSRCRSSRAMFQIRIRTPVHICIPFTISVFVSWCSSSRSKYKFDCGNVFADIQRKNLGTQDHSRITVKTLLTRVADKASTKAFTYQCKQIQLLYNLHAVSPCRPSTSVVDPES